MVKDGLSDTKVNRAIEDRRRAVGEGMKETEKWVTEIASLASRNLVGDLRRLSVYRYPYGVRCTATVEARPRDGGRGREKMKGNGKGEKGKRQRRTPPEIFQAIPVKANVGDTRSKE